MELTPHDLEIAERHIAKREKELAEWPRKRWRLLIIYSLLMLVGVRLVLDGLSTLIHDDAVEVDVKRVLSKGPTPGLQERWVMGAMIKVSTILEARHEIAILSLGQIIAGLMPFTACGSMVGIILLRWKDGERDALICKLLRMKLRELEQGGAPKG
ncbi:MAG: hypothetical protein RLY20_1927 [Verrucomicrobiota bacterium]|jgi:hypothetical protein